MKKICSEVPVNSTLYRVLSPEKPGLANTKNGKIGERGQNSYSVDTTFLSRFNAVSITTFTEAVKLA